jgi:hypothetical protein
MKATQFKSITTVLNKYINKSAEIAKTCVVDNQITFDHLTIGQAKVLAEEARDLQSKTDIFLTAELYHIIGMGNLSASQTATLNKLVKDITMHRSVVKAIAGLPTLPAKISSVSDYKSKIFGLKLEHKVV